MIERVQKHDGRHDHALLTLSDWYHQLVASVVSELNVGQSIKNIKKK